MLKKGCKWLLVIAFLFTLSQPASASEGEKDKTCSSGRIRIELLQWNEVDKIIPRNAIFTVIDIESKKSFQVQRRAGSRHADVQPLTVKDTKIMKSIYDGKWSWKRRAVLISVGNRLITGSMHGMPHGAGALQNDFPGHFCIHFAGSTTHKTRKVDLSHQIMILKAAGKANDYLNSLSSFDLTNAALILIKNQEKTLTRSLIISKIEDKRALFEQLQKIEAIQWKILNETGDTPDSLVSHTSADIKMIVKGHGRINKVVPFTLLRTSPLSPWKINIDPLLQMINQDK
ncbi:hypothetical protein [Heyndrickxia acidicola]|uniref:Uncharacterized protein n=1 Tax=Heyndrickxia acidicola TaxID=209389 RepID=A0ABU6MAJ0_9BACI|nr:hypothetical protein [Heyndrickxia acidicola]MED1201668.1 hypothetical protein [Heyndrickxia acidicola]